jgi:hypothetical protein
MTKGNVNQMDKCYNCGHATRISSIMIIADAGIQENFVSKQSDMRTKINGKVNQMDKVKAKGKVVSGNSQCLQRVGLCFRCEERALYLETGHGSRCECQSPTVNVASCYMYKPVRPVITQVAKGYAKRPRLGPTALSAREEGVAVATDMELQVAEYSKKRICLYWEP